MKINEILNEHIINLFTDNEKARWSNGVWDVLQQSYEKIGGLKTAETPEQLIKKSGLWKLITRNGKVSAVNIYKNKYGRKVIAGGTNGSLQGKKDYFKLRNEDIDLKRVWSEVSGAPEHLMKKYGAIPIPSKFAEFLTKKLILSYDEDGYHYERLIQGSPHTKIIYGHIKLTPDERLEAEKLGLKFNEY